MDVSQGKSTDELASWIDRYCGEHPNETLHKASTAMIETLREGTKP